MLWTIYRCPVPVVGRIQGDCYAGGVGLAAVCDVLVAAEGVNFCLSEARLALLPATIAPYVVRALGEQASRRYFITAERSIGDMLAFDGSATAWGVLVCGIYESTPADMLASLPDDIPMTALFTGDFVKDSLDGMGYQPERGIVIGMPTLSHIERMNRVLRLPVKDILDYFEFCAQYIH